MICDCLLIYTYNMYLWHCYLLSLLHTYTFQQFIIDCCTTVRYCHVILQQVYNIYALSIILYKLQKSKKRRYCIVCHLYKILTFYNQCYNDFEHSAFICDGKCNVLYYNSGI